MSDVVVIPSAAVEALRRKAKKLRKEEGLPHHAALDAVARAGGVFPDWHHFIEAAKATEPAEEAFKHGLVIGMDIKDALDVPKAKLVHFIEDERLVAFVLDEFGLNPSKAMSDAEQWHLDLINETMFFRSRRIVPESLDAAEELSRKDFFFLPQYLRLKGRLLVDSFDDGGEDEGDDHV